MEINENYLACLSSIFSESLYATLERYHSKKGWSMPVIIEYNGKKYILTTDYMDKYMTGDEYDSFFIKRSSVELINDGVYVEYKGLGLNDLMKHT